MLLLLAIYSVEHKQGSDASLLLFSYIGLSAYCVVKNSATEVTARYILLLIV